MKKISTLALACLITMASFATEQKSSVAAQTNYQNVVNSNDDFRHRGEGRDRDDRNWYRVDRDRSLGNRFYNDRDNYYRRDYRGDRDDYRWHEYHRNF